MGDVCRLVGTGKSKCVRALVKCVKMCVGVNMLRVSMCACKCVFGWVGV